MNNKNTTKRGGPATKQTLSGGEGGFVSTKSDKSSNLLLQPDSLRKPCVSVNHVLMIFISS